MAAETYKAFLDLRMAACLTGSELTTWVKEQVDDLAKREKEERLERRNYETEQRKYEAEQRKYKEEQRAYEAEQRQLEEDREERRRQHELACKLLQATEPIQEASANPVVLPATTMLDLRPVHIMSPPQNSSTSLAPNFCGQSAQDPLPGEIGNPVHLGGPSSEHYPARDPSSHSMPDHLLLPVPLASTEQCHAPSSTDIEPSIEKDPMPGLNHEADPPPGELGFPTPLIIATGEPPAPDTSSSPNLAPADEPLEDQIVTPSLGDQELASSDAEVKIALALVVAAAGVGSPLVAYEIAPDFTPTSPSGLSPESVPSSPPRPDTDRPWRNPKKKKVRKRAQ
ncbi:protein enabled homolog [Macrobrachium rosenbergii]|uniref:protein enabled homolog n=1 Tax=Macrobrachium rosenbergii TaxID=79674 RepID=UPI0034D41853